MASDLVDAIYRGPGDGQSGTGTIVRVGDVIRIPRAQAETHGWFELAAPAKPATPSRPATVENPVGGTD